MNKDDVVNMMMGYAGLDKTPYYCVSCGKELAKVSVKTALQDYRKLFWCEDKTCLRFGFVTVIARKKL